MTSFRVTGSPDRRKPGRMRRALPSSCPQWFCAAALLAVALAAACTGGGQPSPLAVTPGPGTASAIAAESSPEPPSASILRLSVREAPTHFDVHQEVSPSLITWGPGLVYSRLFRFRSGPDVAMPSEEIECDLCEAWEQIDPTTYRVTLRPGVRWQPLPPVAGRRLEAEDVVFSYRRQATAGWPNAALMANLTGISAIDGLTLELRTGGMDAELLTRLADGHSKIVAHEAVEESGNLLQGPVVGSGPWMLASAVPERMEFIRNADYYEPGLPRLDGLVVHVIPDEQTRLAALLTNQIDVDQPSYTGLLLAQERQSDLVSISLRAPGVGVEVGLNPSRPPLDSLAVRQALLKAWDPWRYIDDIWQGQAYVSVGLSAPGASWELDEDELRPLFGRPAEARAVLDSVGAASGPPIDITVGQFGERYLQQARAMADDLAVLGVQTTLTEVSTREFGDRVWLGGEYQVFVGAQPPAGLSELLRHVHHSQGEAHPGGDSSAVLDALVEEQERELDPSRRRELVLDIQREIMRGAYRFNAATRVRHWVWAPHVTDFWPNVVRGDSSFLANVWLAEGE